MSSDDDTDIDFELLEAEEKMEKAVRVARDDFATVRTGRPTPAIFARITGRLLRHPDAGAAARVVQRARAAHDHRQPVRQGLAGGSREGDP